MNTNYGLTALLYKEVRIQKVLFRKRAFRILKPITPLCQRVLALPAQVGCLVSPEHPLGGRYLRRVSGLGRCSEPLAEES